MSQSYLRVNIANTIMPYGVTFIKLTTRNVKNIKNILKNTTLNSTTARACRVFSRSRTMTCYFKNKYLYSVFFTLLSFSVKINVFI